MNDLLLVGLSHRTAPVALRERFALDEAARASLRERLLRVPGFTEAAVLSTCNRTEVAAVAAGADAADGVLELLLDGRADVPRDRFTVHRGRDAARHVLEVACGLDSMVLGETQILGQVRQAFDEASRAGAIGPLLGRLFPVALRAAKRAHHETRLSSGTASVGSVAVELAAKVFADLEARTALLLGAGETGATIARALCDRRVARLLVAGRGAARARELADRLGPPAVAVDAGAALADLVAEADVVLSAAASGDGRYLLDTAFLAPCLARRRRPLLVVDVALPRNVEPAVRELPEVFLYDLDDLEEVAARTLARRRAEVPRVAAIVAHELAIAERAVAEARELRPWLSALHGRFDAERQRELRHVLARLPPEHRAAVEGFSRRLIDKLLAGPARRLRDANGRAPGLLAALAELFELADPGERPPRDAASPAAGDEGDAAPADPERPEHAP